MTKDMIDTLLENIKQMILNVLNLKKWYMFEETDHDLSTEQYVHVWNTIECLRNMCNFK